MAWTAEKVRALRESNPSETAKKDEESGKWTAERVRALRTSTPSQPADAAALRDRKQTEAANADLTSKAFDEYRANNNLGFADEAGSRVEAMSAAAKYGVPMSTNVLEQVGSGAAAYGD